MNLAQKNYVEGEYSFPRQDINPKEKDESYHRRNTEAIYSLFCKGKTAWGVNAYDYFQTLRDYSCGNQSTDRYKSWLLSDQSEGATETVATDSFDSIPLSRVSKKEGWYAMMWQNISPAPTILEALHGQFDKLDHDLYVNAIDSNSKDIEENEAFLKYFEGKNLAWQTEYKQKAGIPIDEEVYYPKSQQEFEMFKAQDGFKLGVARSMQKLLRYSFGVSKWDTVARKKVIDDIICLRYGALRDYYDSEDHKFKTKWADPARTVIQFSNESDYSDSEYGGYFEFWTISNLKRKRPDVDESKWKALARSSNAMGFLDNPRTWNDKYSALDPSTHLYGYDSFKVPVFWGVWIDMDAQKRQYYTSYGRRLVRDLEYDEEGKNTENKEVKTVHIRKVRECYWVIGTEITFDSGVVKMASRKGYSKPQLPIHVEQLLQPSIVERLIPILDQIELTFLRYQNSLAQMVENGYALNTSMLGNVTYGGKKLKPAEVVKLFRQTGFLLYQYAAGTGLYTGGVATPITEIEGGMKKRVEETLQTLDMWFGVIKSMTGIDVVALATTPVATDPKELPAGQVQITQNVLKTIMYATSELKQSVGECMMRRIQTGIRTNKSIRKAYAGVISNADMEAIVRMEAEGTQYGLTLKPKPDKIAKARFEKWIDIALQNTREQRPGIDLNDAIYFMSQLENGADLTELEKQLEYAIEKNKQEAQANSERMMQVQAEENRKSEEQKQQGELANIKAEAEVKLQEELVRGQIKDRESNKEIAADLYKSLREEAAAEEGVNISGGR